jgi:hypothetical protein
MPAQDTEGSVLQAMPESDLTPDERREALLGKEWTPEEWEQLPEAPPLVIPAGATGPTYPPTVAADPAAGATGLVAEGAVFVSFPTNVDLQRNEMTDEMWIDLGKFVADLAAHTRARQAAARDAAHGKT